MEPSVKRQVELIQDALGCTPEVAGALITVYRRTKRVFEQVKPGGFPKRPPDELGRAHTALWVAVELEVRPPDPEKEWT